MLCTYTEVLDKILIGWGSIILQKYLIQKYKINFK